MHWQFRQGKAICTFVRSYGYDLSDQLVSQSTKTALVWDDETRFTWSYEAAGNWLSHNTDTTFVTRKHDVMNRIKSQGGDGYTIVEGKANEHANVEVIVENMIPPFVVRPPLLRNIYELDDIRFSAKIPLEQGWNSVFIKATDYENEQTLMGFDMFVRNVSHSYTYDANGNMLTDGSRAFMWDAKDRLTSVTVAGTTYHWDYDWQDRRVREYQYPAASSKPTVATKQFIWDGDVIARECIGTGALTGNITRTYYSFGFADNPTMNVKYITTSDHLGNVRDIIGLAGVAPGLVGKTLTRYDYSAYLEGNVEYRHPSSPSVDLNLRVIGRYYHHAPSGLELAKYRAYDPKLGGFISEDPIEENGGINMYGYAGNNPINTLDPLGLASIKWCPGTESLRAALESTPTGRELIKRINDVKHPTIDVINVQIPPSPSKYWTANSAVNINSRPEYYESVSGDRPYAPGQVTIHELAHALDHLPGVLIDDLGNTKGPWSNRVLDGQNFKSCPNRGKHEQCLGKTFF